MKKITAMAGTIIVFWLVAGCSSTDCKNPADCYQKGLKILNSGKRDAAYKYLAKAANDDPSNVNYQWAAAGSAPNPKFALFHVKTAWDNGLRNKAVFEAYLGLSRVIEPSQSPFFALQLYQQLPDSIRTDDLRAGIFFSYKMYDSTLAILQGLFKTKPSPDVTNSIARVYIAKNENDKAAELLIESRNAKLLNKDGYLLLNLAFLRNFDYAGCASVFETAKKNGLYDGEFALAQARGLVAQEKFDEAENLLRTQLKVPDDGKNQELFKNVRSVLAFIYFGRGDSNAILALDSGMPGGTGEANPEKMLYKIMAKRLSDTATIITALTDLFKKIPAYPELQIILAQELTRAGKNLEALKVYQNLPDVYLGSPHILVERARLLDRNGKSTDALAMLSFLHSRKIATKPSLELFRYFPGM
jgi:tetratricopeptide (TPR) repeat protein